MPDLQTIECLYVGRRVLSNGKLAEGYLTLEQAGAHAPAEWDRFENEVSLFEATKRSKARARSGAVVGGVYKMEVALTDGKITTARTAAREFMRLYENRDIVLSCETRDDAADLHVRNARLMTKLKDDDTLMNKLSQLRALYQRTPYADRMALELLVLGALRNGVK